MYTAQFLKKNCKRWFQTKKSPPIIFKSKKRSKEEKLTIPEPDGIDWAYFYDNAALRSIGRLRNSTGTGAGTARWDSRPLYFGQRLKISKHVFSSSFYSENASNLSTTRFENQRTYAVKCLVAFRSNLFICMFILCNIKPKFYVHPIE